MVVRVHPGEQNSGIIVSVLPPPLQRYTGAGIVAQLVEQQTENLCVVGSIPTDTTESRNNGKPPLPYGSRSINPVKWGKIALSYKGYYDWLLINLSKFESWWSSKTLNVVSDTDSSLGVMGVKAGWKGYISNPHW